MTEPKQKTHKKQAAQKPEDKLQKPEDKQKKEGRDETPKVAAKGVTVCKFCGENIPRLEYFPHLNTKHREEMQAIRHKPKRKTQDKLQKPEDSQKAQPQKKEGEEQEKATAPKVAATIKGRFITKEIDLSGDILVFYWLAKAAFPEYDASEGEWIADCIEQFYSEHSEELGLNKLFDKTYEVVPVGGEK